MPGLTLPTVDVHESFLAAMAEFTAEGRGVADDDTMIGNELRAFGDRWQHIEPFTEYVLWLRDQAREEAPRPDGYVPCTTFWWVEGKEYFGRLAIRHRLTPILNAHGGHIGYDVRPSARRRGHATAMLREGLVEAHKLGIDPVLITCDEDNVASRRVIEHNGGVPAERLGDKLRYWAPTAP